MSSKETFTRIRWCVSPIHRPFHHFERFQSEDERCFEWGPGISGRLVKEVVECNRITVGSIVNVV